MRIIIVGFGRVGTQLVQQLGTKQHEVTVIDQERHMADHPLASLPTRLMIGNAIDAEILKEAGVEDADVLFATTRDENTNLMVAQVARIVFNVPKVIAMIYDPSREASYHEAGIETFCLTLAGAEYLASQITKTPAGDLRGAWKRAHDEMMKLVKEPVRSVATQGKNYYVIILGGSLVGYFLARNLMAKGHEVTIIEDDPEKYNIIIHQIDCNVIFGDGSTIPVLEQAGANRADVFVAVTNHDHDNLIACQVAKSRFGVKKAIARVKNPRNEAILQRLGVDVTVSSTGIIAQMIERELPMSTIKTLLDFKSSNLEIVEYDLEDEAPVIGHPIRDLTMPKDSNIVTILRNNDAVVPRGETVFSPKDVVLVLMKANVEPDVKRVLLG
ncbi:MAG: NAD-binding protein [Acidobacteriia bacterium]|nr:NAD-binding protein [Terriglobia bacterium]